MTQESRTVAYERTVAAPAATLFELIADPARQPEWDGNGNLAEAAPGQRVRAVGDVFRMVLAEGGAVRENHVVAFDEGRLIAWRPSEVGKPQPGHEWRWELEPRSDTETLVRHTYDGPTSPTPGGSNAPAPPPPRTCAPRLIGSPRRRSVRYDLPP